jgi:hypothetical protein
MVTSDVPQRGATRDRGDAIAAPAIDSWSGPLLDACAASVGSELEYAEVPAALDQAQGSWAFGFRLRAASMDPDNPWGVPLVVRIALDRGFLDREAAAMQLGRPCGAPEVRQIAALGPDDDQPRWALISAAATGVALPELIGFNLHHADDLLRGFAANHEAIHRLPVDDLGGDHPVPVIDAPAEVARIDPGRFPAERSWLDEHLPTRADVVLCHGGYQPLCVSGPPPADWLEHGGPGKGLSVANWSGAVLAEPEFDVAFTLVAFWSAPWFAKNRAERTAIKMIRNTLLNTYTLGYSPLRELDPDRLRFWRAFHAVRGLARLEGAYDGEGSPFESQDRGPLPDDLGAELSRHFRQLTRIR